MRFRISLCIALGACAFSQMRGVQPDSVLAWPEPTMTSRPWSRWWWLGSAVDEPNLKRLIGMYHEAGLGGLEICPIYGAKGYESRFIPYLSPKWVAMFGVAASETKSLGMGLDLTTGTGWPMGGPWITLEYASAGVVLKKLDVPGGKVDLQLAVPKLEAAEAVGADGTTIDLSKDLEGSHLTAELPAGKWKIYAVGQREPLQKVKRSAPGGEGNVLDPYSTAAMDHYLARFDEAFKDYTGPRPRAEFHDSFEYYGANWTSDFFDQFEKRRGYDLRSELPAFFGDGDTDRAERVRYDYRSTISDLHQDYVKRWTEWSHAHGSLTREQAHGSPSNIEDTYADADIPETEGSFGGVIGADEQLPMMQFASSAAHLSGRTLASSETFTWLGEHFQVPLARLKPTADFFFLAGINHIFFHGIPYSPADAPWPGWLFYAAVNLGPEGGIWHDLPAFNAYATRVQSILQSGKPDNSVLLYFPVADFWQNGGDTARAAASTSTTSDTVRGLVEQFTTPGKWMQNTPFHTTAMALWRIGVSFDEITDSFIARARTGNGQVLLGGNAYSAILLPPTHLIPDDTVEHLIELARGGATLLVQGDLPKDVPGFGHAAERRAHLQTLLSQLDFEALAGTAIKAARLGSGRILVSNDLQALLSQGGVPREPLFDLGLRSVKRLQPNGTDYFIVNSGEKAVDRWVPLASAADQAVILDPLAADRIGLAALRPGKTGVEVYLQLEPGQSLIVRTTRGANLARAPAWVYEKLQIGSTPITGTWSVHFAEGGPVLPKDYTASSTGSWTTQSNDPEAKRFAGTAVYKVAFTWSPKSDSDWLLDLGKVCESARVRLNGKSVGTVWCAPFSIPVGSYLKSGTNELEVEVTNVAANRIADLDRRHVAWKNFYEINFVNRAYEPFDASGWPVRDSGLVGPVSLRPLEIVHPNG